ncbi:hypothetical protein SAMN03159382_01677 [Pseudomonas sp. NFACC23-1]|uniref:hypothetical protein n=1 Tax=unclassified Pseudomonas TaxID=196821 RepID=UPI0008832340|nr:MULTISPECIES: hypothetical protein [unclassified Pseudomonas]SDB18596.1 hypothetical protein SAMN03159386_01337 [Pseudomonas sp. NFACC17-2]SEJ23820.1 hypothetical protein SAMN03159382_01677 [Pseudomonas sp. NFACC23-1]SFW92000.1 hypothetical protein SAMN05660640_05334 [Pseudomonas sp. NFACC16-2]
MDLSNFERQVSKTGFELEYRVARILKEEGWSLISNRCYLDDQEETVREIDLLAYKVRNVKHVSVYTALIISCKKSESNVWALLSRGVDLADPNSDWEPFKGWCNHPGISYYLDDPEWAKKYYERMTKVCPSIFQVPIVDVFAFQEMNRVSGACQNDKNIFASITSLMKAQSYEMSTLAERKKGKPCVYQFNLLSVMDSELVRILFDGEKVAASQVDSEDYVSRYILRKKDSTSRIKFVTAKKFGDVIKDYSRLHSENCAMFEDVYEDFYRDVYKKYKKSSILVEELRLALIGKLSSAYYRAAGDWLSYKDVSIFWDEKKEIVTIDFDLSVDVINRMNASKECKEVGKAALLKVYRYKGDFEYSVNIPF